MFFTQDPAAYTESLLVELSPLCSVPVLHQRVGKTVQSDSDLRVAVSQECPALLQCLAVHLLRLPALAASKVDVILQKFNRDYLYGMGRFDEYAGGLLLKWGDGYSRKHIWVTVDGDNLLFQTSHERKCSKSYCVGGQHVFTPEMWRDVRQINAELAEQFQRPVQERTDD